MLKMGIYQYLGWKENSNQLTLDYLKEVNDYGVSRLIYTDINRDGMKQSPNFEETSKVAGHIKLSCNYIWWSFINR
jgi:phosphoribosylformimino-5-aminoimidazole carboxamide ribotide isomerase